MRIVVFCHSLLSDWNRSWTPHARPRHAAADPHVLYPIEGLEPQGDLVVYVIQRSRALPQSKRGAKL